MLKAMTFVKKMAQSLFHKKSKKRTFTKKLQIVYLLRLNNLNISSRTSRRRKYTFISSTTFVYYTMRNKKKGAKINLRDQRGYGNFPKGLVVARHLQNAKARVSFTDKYVCSPSTCPVIIRFVRINQKGPIYNKSNYQGLPITFNGM